MAISLLLFSLVCQLSFVLVILKWFFFSGVFFFGEGREISQREERREREKNENETKIINFK